MKITIIAISVFLFPAIIFGQQSFDCLLKAKALIKSGKHDQAIEMLSSNQDISKESRLLTARAEANLLKGKLQDAIADLNAANSLVRYCGEYDLARAYAIKGDAATSVYHLELNLRSSFKKSEKEIMLDPSFSRIENRPEWRSFWKKEWYSGLEKGISEIEYYLSKGKSADAEEVLSGLQKSYPDTREVIYAATLVNSSTGSKSGEAIKSLTGLLASDPDNEKYLMTLAKLQTGVFNFAGASVTYSRLLNLEVPDAGLLLERAECYRKTGETEKARSDISRYLSFYPEDKTALSLAGKIETSSGNNLKAIEYFSENLKLHPNDPECYVDRADSYLLSKSWDWAAKDYSMSLDLAPGNSYAWLNKGIALVNSGKTDDACHDFRMALSLGNKRATDYVSRYCIK
jgi:tetratricopeptide (TPR) repeat protein